MKAEYKILLRLIKMMFLAVKRSNKTVQGKVYLDMYDIIWHVTGRLNNKLLSSMFFVSGPFFISAFLNPSCNI